MRLLSGLTMLLIGALVIATSLSEVDAFGVRKNGTMGEEHQQEMSTSKISTDAVPNKVVNRGKVKFQVPKSLMMAVATATTNQVARNRMSRVRTTEAPNSIGRDSTEDEKMKTTTSKVIWWTSTTPSPISLDSLEQDDAVSLEMKSNPAPSVVSRVLPVNRFNRFRTTTAVPTPVTRDSFEQDDDEFVLTLKTTTPKSVNKPATTQSRFNRVRTTTATPNLIARDSLELNDVSVEVAPVLNRGRSRGQSKVQMTPRKVTTINRLNRTQTPPATSTIADSKEVDLSLEDVALTILSTTQAPAGTTTEMATTTADDVTTTPATFLIISKQSDERIDLSTEIEDLMTTQGTTIVTTESDEVTTSAIPTTISKQSDEFDDLDDILILQTTTTTAAPTTTTTTAPTTTAPVVTRPQSRGRSRMQSTTSATTTKQIPRVNRVRTTMAPQISNEQNDSIIMAVLTSTTTNAPVSKNRFSQRSRTTTVRAPSVSTTEIPAAPTATTTMRNNLVGNRFNRFRTTTTTTTTTTAAPVIIEKEKAAAPKRVIPAPRKRFGNVITNVARLPVKSDDSGEKETILLGDVLKVNKASSNNVVLVAVESEAVSKMMKTETIPAVPATSTRGRMGRGRMTTTTPQPIASRQSSEDNISLEDLVVKINRPTEQQMVKTSSDPVIVAQPVADVSLEQMDKVVVPVEGGLMMVVDDVDVSDEMPATTTLDPISIESTEKDDLTLIMDDVTVTAVLPEAAVVVDLPDISDEIIPVIVATTTTTVNPISMESEELPVVNKPRTRKIINRGRLNRKPAESQI